MADPKIAIVGTGNVGAALARNFVRHGFELYVANRTHEDAEKLARELGAKAHAVSPAEAALAAEIVFLAVPGGALAEAARGLEEVAGKIVVDCTNPLRWEDGPVYAPPPEGSNAELLAARLPKAKVIKAFNTFGAEFHERPELGSTKADLYFAGSADDAKRRFAEVTRKLGFEPVDVGGLRNARHLESLAVLWIQLAMVGGKGRNVAFKLLERR